LTSPPLVQHNVTPQGASGEYEQTLWQPDGSLLLLQSIAATDKTRTYSAWRLTFDDKPPTLLLTTHDFALYNLSAHGGDLLFERYTNEAINMPQGLWIYQLADHETFLIDSAGFNAQWVLAQR
jgi:hypothetical protein